MSDNSAIEWTDASWNPLLGCERVSPGCDSCYAITTATIRAGNPHPKVAAAFEGLTERRDGRLNWTGRINLLPDRLTQPLRWKKPKRIFVNSQSDLFHKDVPDEYVARVFAVMHQAPRHTFQVLTKRHARMRSLLSSPEFVELVQSAIDAMYDDPDDQLLREPWPPSNVWLGVSVENQQWADIRIPALLDTPAAVRWISAEPLLGPIDLRQAVSDRRYACHACEFGNHDDCNTHRVNRLGWVVVGGESGPGARPMHPGWARSLRNQCVSAGVPFFFKQFGEWGPAPWRVDREPGESVDAYKARSEALCATHAYAMWADQYGHKPYKPSHKPWSTERTGLDGGTHAPIRRWGKKAAGRELDGRTWDEYPTTAQAVTA